MKLLYFFILDKMLTSWLAIDQKKKYKGEKVLLKISNFQFKNVRGEFTK